MKLPKIAVKIIPDLDETSAKALAYRKAREKGEIDAFREADLFASMAGVGKEQSYKDVAKLFNVTPKFVENRVVLAKIPSNVRDKFSPHGEISTSHWEVMVSLDNPKDQLAWC